VSKQPLFCKKAAQKTFVMLAMGTMTPTPMSQHIKVFLLLFVHKKKCLFVQNFDFIARLNLASG
jgi:hypothetical protein